MASSNSSVTALCGFQPILDVKNNNHVLQDLGKFAVAEFNKKHQEASALVFVEVVEAQSQVVASIRIKAKMEERPHFHTLDVWAGTNYRLHIEALKAGYVRHYKAPVYEKPRKDVKTLTSFESVFA
ncbi:cysteine proteinase inhibitor 1-like [Nymphaea colorata]|nr:cysteine proteinase inhibitor 1-like [Nymphaea colorata]